MGNMRVCTSACWLTHGYIGHPKLLGCTLKFLFEKQVAILADKQKQVPCIVQKLSTLICAVPLLSTCGEVGMWSF